LSRVGGGT